MEKITQQLNHDHLPAPATSSIYTPDEFFEAFLHAHRHDVIIKYTYGILRRKAYRKYLLLLFTTGLIHTLLCPSFGITSDRCQRQNDVACYMFFVLVTLYPVDGFWAFHRWIARMYGSEPARELLRASWRVWVMIGPCVWVLW
ncbi:hypothetical protein BDW74DRAFT_183084 [Aspergillus multicolor]|uniref:uncharacterized protein n=1 Tax=Aspergillus multicolor TaxID=41759 RepID=UPI003CCD7541